MHPAAGADLAGGCGAGSAGDGAGVSVAGKGGGDVNSDKRRLVKALRQANVAPVQVRMAAILLAVNGIESALKFVRKEEEQVETPDAAGNGLRAGRQENLKKE